MTELRGEHLTKVFPDGTRALDGVSFAARSGRMLTLLGPSGCGKSTLLRMVAGLERPTSGRLLLDGRPIDDMPPGRRGIGFVFQDYALYPHLTVAGNLSLALETSRVPRAEIRERVARTAETLDITGLLERRPGQLSGGQQQRVALGRALVRSPKLYLLDEPLSNLDALLREGMREELKSLFARVSSIVLYVTHDQTEAMSLSDDLVVMQAGRILQSGSPLEIYRRPATIFVAGFVGTPRMTLWRGVTKGGVLECDGVQVPLPPGISSGRELCVGIRPEDVVLTSHAVDGGWRARPVMVEPLGSRTLATLAVGSGRARALVDPDMNLPDPVWMRWPGERLHWFDAASGIRIGETERGENCGEPT